MKNDGGDSVFYQLLSFACGLFFGVFSESPFFLFLCIMIYEGFLFAFSTYDDSMSFVFERLVANILFLVGYFTSRRLAMRNSGCEDAWTTFYRCYFDER